MHYTNKRHDDHVLRIIGFTWTHACHESTNRYIWPLIHVNILVADFYNNRILLVDRTVTSARPFQLPVNPKYPHSVSYDPSSGRLIVVEGRGQFSVLEFDGIWWWRTSATYALHSAAESRNHRRPGGQFGWWRSCRAAAIQLFRGSHLTHDEYTGNVSSVFLLISYWFRNPTDDWSMMIVAIIACIVSV